MKRLRMATTLALFGLAPAIGMACEYADQSSASATPPAQLASTAPPAATKVPPAKATQALSPKAAKQEAVKAKAPAPEQKVAAVTGS